MARVLTFVLVLFVVLLGVVFAFAFFVRKNGMFFPDRFPGGRWDTTQWSVQPTDHWIITSDRVKLHAWLFRARDAQAPLVIWFHGNAGNLTNRAEMAAELARRGASVLLFDWRGYGKSEGRPSESGLFRDALAAFDFAQSLHPPSLVLYGESLGGPYAAYVAKERKPVRAVIIENSFPSLMSLGNALYKLGWTAPFALRTTQWLNEAGAPVLVMHGTRDRVIPYALGKQLYDDLRVPKEMLTANAGHCEIPALEGGRYYDAVINFVK